MTAGEKAECKLIAGAIIKEVLKEHIESCPHHQAYLISRARVVGLVIGVIFASGVTSGTAATIIMKLFMG